MFSVDPVLELLGRAVDLTALRHSVYATNIANASTEGYSRIEVAVADVPDAALDGAMLGEPRVMRTPGEAVRLDEEMAGMARNAVRYQALLAAYEKAMSLLRSAAREGRE